MYRRMYRAGNSSETETKKSCQNVPQATSLSDPNDDVVENPSWSVGRIDRNLTCDETGLIKYTDIYEIGERGYNEEFMSMICREEIRPSHNSITVKCVQMDVESDESVSIGICRDTYPTCVSPGWYPLSIGLHGDDGQVYLGECETGTHPGRGEPYKWQQGDVIRCEVNHLGNNGKICVGGEFLVTFYKLGENGKKELLATVPTGAAGLEDTYKFEEKWENKYRDVQFRFIVSLYGKGTQVKVENYLPSATVGDKSESVYHGHRDGGGGKQAWSVDRITENLSIEDSGLVTFTSSGDNADIGFINFLQPVTSQQSSITIRCVDIPASCSSKIWIGLCPQQYYGQEFNLKWNYLRHPLKKLKDRKLAIALSSVDGQLYIEGPDTLPGKLKPHVWQNGDVIRCDVTQFGDNQRLEVGGKLALRFTLIDDGGTATVIATVPTDSDLHDGDRGEGGDGPAGTHTLADAFDYREYGEHQLIGLMRESDVEFRFCVWMWGYGTQIQVSDYLHLSENCEIWRPEGMSGAVCDSQGVVRAIVDDVTEDDVWPCVYSQPITINNTSASVTVTSGGSLGVSWGRHLGVVFDSNGDVEEIGERRHGGISRKWQSGDIVKVKVTDMAGRHSFRVGDQMEIAFFFNGDEVWREMATLRHRTDDLYKDSPTHDEAVFMVGVSSTGADTIQLHDFYPSAFHKEFDLWTAALATKDVTKVKYLIELYMDVDFVNSRDAQGNVILHHLSEDDDTDQIAYVLLSHECIHANVENNKGDWPDYGG